MDSRGITASSPVSERSRVCSQCRQNRDRIIQELGFQSALLEQYISDDQCTRLRDLAFSLMPETFLKFEYQGIATGRLAAYETLLHLKKKDLAFTPTQWELCR